LIDFRSQQRNGHGGLLRAGKQFFHDVLAIKRQLPGQRTIQLKRGNRLNLSMKPSNRIRVLAELSVEDLQGNLSRKSRLFGKEDSPHTSLPERPQQLVTTQEKRNMPGEQFLCLPLSELSGPGHLVGQRLRRRQVATALRAVSNSCKLISAQQISLLQLPQKCVYRSGSHRRQSLQPGFALGFRIAGSIQIVASSESA